MRELGVVTRALLGVARDGLDERALAETICRACVDGLDIDGASISVLTATDARETLCASDQTADVLEELQYTLNEGPCVEAATSGHPVLVPDVHDRTATARWPVFASAIGERTPVRALFALPLRWGAINLGVLDMYRRAPGNLDDEQRRDAFSAADVAALLLLGQRTDPGGDEGWLESATASRAEVHQATGMVLVQLGVSAPEALARLRAYAFSHGRLLIDIARDVVARRISFVEDVKEP
ncbi:MAG TPA: GAF and ANTAR domain-containing protein [Pseudonocardia sp.]|uniref:GAF and ANTAR domain-containing protein n=1 Tax=Pseudonocardia sp. TaxID=60912 RepID=UPI002B4B7C13|nr:GAF and ANTAR domain-containing protein [Pseudonocardia sp.]HLU58117.1 GAF and ANTAR domain-containing protein [Pseudonocardia sp.]